LKQAAIYTGLSWNSVLITILFAGLAPACLAQEQAVSVEPKSETITAMKLSLPSSQLAEAYEGVTGVPVEQGLDAVLRGQEPKSAKELQALENQQVRVSQKIAEVTVSITQGSAQGSGVIVSSEGIIFTAAHVAGRPNKDAKITLSDGRVVRGITLGMNRFVDAGLIKIVTPSSAPWPHATLSKSTDSLRLGQWVIAAGHPGGYDEHRPPVIRIGRLLDAQQTTLVSDCALIGGDSGGPLFDLSGRLIGIHSRIGSEFADNMHVPVSMYREHWARMAKSESWGVLPGQNKPIIGVRGSGDKTKSEHAVIENVIEGSPAARAGIRTGDIIVKFDGVDVGSFDDLAAAVESAIPGDAVKVVLIRDQKKIEIRLIVGVEADAEADQQ
jgi:S1-C subfamily serine protease